MDLLLLLLEFAAERLGLALCGVPLRLNRRLLADGVLDEGNLPLALGLHLLLLLLHLPVVVERRAPRLLHLCELRAQLGVGGGAAAAATLAPAAARPRLLRGLELRQEVGVSQLLLVQVGLEVVAAALLHLELLARLLQRADLVGEHLLEHALQLGRVVLGGGGELRLRSPQLAAQRVDLRRLRVELRLHVLRPRHARRPIGCAAVLAQLGQKGIHVDPLHHPAARVHVVEKLAQFPVGEVEPLAQAAHARRELLVPHPGLQLSHRHRGCCRCRRRAAPRLRLATPLRHAEACTAAPLRSLSATFHSTPLYSLSVRLRLSLCHYLSPSHTRAARSRASWLVTLVEND